MKIKICGITNIEDANKVVDSGADAIGFIFYKKSKRYVDVEIAERISYKVPPFVSKVGVFVNEDRDLVLDIARKVKLDVVQLHGEEDREYIDYIEKEFKVLKAFRVKSEDELEKIKELKLDWFLLDAYSEKEYGGTGDTFNWEIAKKAKEFGKVILAGGVTKDNIKEIVENIKPYAVDLSSGVEDSPGRKNRGKIMEFMELV